MIRVRDVDQLSRCLQSQVSVKHQEFINTRTQLQHYQLTHTTFPTFVLLESIANGFRILRTTRRKCHPRTRSPAPSTTNPAIQRPPGPQRGTVSSTTQTPLRLRGRGRNLTNPLHPRPPQTRCLPRTIPEASQSTPKLPRALLDIHASASAPREAQRGRTGGQDAESAAEVAGRG